MHGVAYETPMHTSMLTKRNKYCGYIYEKFFAKRLIMPNALCTPCILLDTQSCQVALDVPECHIDNHCRFRGYPG